MFGFCSWGLFGFVRVFNFGSGDESLGLFFRGCTVWGKIVLICVEFGVSYLLPRFARFLNLPDFWRLLDSGFAKFRGFGVCLHELFGFVWFWELLLRVCLASGVPWVMCFLGLIQYGNLRF